MQKVFIAVRFFLRDRPSTHYFCYGNCAAGSKPIKELFNAVNRELNKVYNIPNK